MTNSQILNSGFIKAFINQYFDIEIYVEQAERARLISSLYSEKEEKIQAILREIDSLKIKILALDSGELNVLATEYMYSCNPKRHDYIEYEKRNEYWINIFSQTLAENTISLTLFHANFQKFTKKHINRFKSPEELQYRFLKVYEILKPIEKDLNIVRTEEKELLEDIEYTITEFKENGFWNISTSHFDCYKNTSVFIFELYQYCDLLVSLDRLNSYKDSLAYLRDAELQNPLKQVQDDLNNKRNPFPKIFTSYLGFQIFEKYISEVVNKKTEYADYSFLFYALKKDEFIFEMRQKKFIEFLGKEYHLKFANIYNQFKFCSTVPKVKAYTLIKSQFKS